MIWVMLWVEVGWFFDYVDQQCYLVEFEFGQWLVEEILVGQVEVMDCLLFILVEEYFVEIGFEDVVFVVVQFQQYCYYCFVDFVVQVVFVVQEEVFY